MMQMDQKANDYANKTRYLILVNKSTHKIGVYRWDGGWNRRIYESCSTGTSSAPTIEGTFYTRKGAQYDSYGTYTHWYLTDFSSGCSIWSCPCYKDTKTVANGTLGTNNDDVGCIRVRFDTAEWLWDAVADDARIVVY